MVCGIKIEMSWKGIDVTWKEEKERRVAMVALEEIRSKENIRGTWGFNVAFTKDAIIRIHTSGSVASTSQTPSAISFLMLMHVSLNFYYH